MSQHQFSGQTDSVLKVELPSRVEVADWVGGTSSVGGVISIEVRTIFVGDGANIEIEVIDGEGKTVDTFKGKVFSNLHRRQYIVKDNQAGRYPLLQSYRIMDLKKIQVTYFLRLRLKSEIWK